MFDLHTILPDCGWFAGSLDSIGLNPARCPPQNREYTASSCRDYGDWMYSCPNQSFALSLAVSSARTM